MKKRFAGIFAAALMVFALLPMTALADGTHTHGTEAITFEKEIKTFDDLQDLFANGGSGYLANDITATAGLTVAANADLCLNGKKLDLDGKGNITVSSGTTFNLYDCGANGTITGGTGSQAGGVFVEQSSQDKPAGKFTMKGGNIVGNTSTGAGGGVYLQMGATFDMDGGSIVGNKANRTGGGVGISKSAVFTMTGGKIKNNEAQQAGGGVYIDKGTFAMSGGEIGNNTAAMFGGGVCIGNGTFTMDGGKIADNNVNNGYGAGVYVNTQAAFAMKGDSVISGNIGGQGAGVYTKGTFTMSGNSEVTNNTGTNGGGVGVDNGANFVMSESSKITNNAGTNGGGLCVNDGGLFQMFGSSTINNNIGSGDGGGVFANGSVTLGGEAKITGNIKGEIKNDVLIGDPQNVFLPNGKYITLGTNLKPTGNFKVDVTTQTAPTDGVPVKITTNGTSTDTGYFASDDTDYEVKYNASGYLELAVKTAPSTTIADILPADFPTSNETAWITKQGFYTCRLDSSNLSFDIDDGGYTAATTAPVTPSGDNYVYTDEDGSVTFNMENGKLTSITLMVNGDDNTYVYALRFGVTVIGGNYVKGYLVDNGTAYCW